MSPSLCLAYYCSGHGYGHATRVSAFARHLLEAHKSKDTDTEGTLVVYIVSSAPQHVFADSIELGAKYRYAEIDPVIVQPLAYRVDRRKSVQVLKRFLEKKDELLKRETSWLERVRASCVLSDAAFLGCLAAKSIHIPSILITNFTFDSVYSYLSTSLLDTPTLPLSHTHTTATPSLLDIIPDDPIPHTSLAPLVEQIHQGYKCADLLVRLPGYIPIPAFFEEPALPSTGWVDVSTRRMRPHVVESLGAPCGEQELLPALNPFDASSSRKQDRVRKVIQAPLIVRPPTPHSASHPSVYTSAGRSRLLSSIGVPLHLHDPATTKILIVSFGGQVFKRPNTPRSGMHSRNSSREVAGLPNGGLEHGQGPDLAPKTIMSRSSSGSHLGSESQEISSSFRSPTPHAFNLHLPQPTPIKGIHRTQDDTDDREQAIVSSRLATPNHLWIPGAPPASKPPLSPSIQQTSFSIPVLNTIPPTPYPEQSNNGFLSSHGVEGHLEPNLEDLDIPRLLPDSSWIAIVCGVSKEQWVKEKEMGGEDLPEEFYVAPRDVYMPDLTAVADVLLGKLGYGTVSECVDACTPFVYVSRPLFIEEHGLCVLLDQEGVGVELSRQSYEAGDWGHAVAEAYGKGKDGKERKRLECASGVTLGKREGEGRELARNVLGWVRDWDGEE